MRACQTVCKGGRSCGGSGSSGPPMASKTPPRPDRSPPGDGLAVSRPGAATMSPARNTPSPRSTLGRSGEDPGAVPPWPNRVLIQPAPPRGDRHPVDQAGGVDLVTEFRQAPAAKRHAPGGRQLAGDRLDLDDHRRGKRRDRPGRLRSLHPERPSWLNRLRHFDTVLTAIPSRPAIWMFCSTSAASTILARRTLRCCAVGQRSRPCSTRRSVAVSVTVNGLGRLTSG
jgi:hypothetical protein